MQLTDFHTPHPSELLAEFALGVLSDADADHVREYIANDPDAMSEVEEMLRVARLLPFAAEDREPSSDLRSGVLDRISREPAPVATAPEPKEQLPANVIPMKKRPSWFVPMAAAAAAVLVVAAGVGGFALGDSGSGDDELRAVSERQDSMLAAVSHGRYETASAENNGVRVSVVAERGATDAYTYVEGLPPLPAGKAYQAWFTKDMQAFEAGPTFATSAGSVWLQAHDAMDLYAAMAFTVEDDKGVQQPTQAPFVVVPLQASALVVR